MERVWKAYGKRPYRKQAGLKVNAGSCGPAGPNHSRGARMSCGPTSLTRRWRGHRRRARAPRWHEAGSARSEPPCTPPDCEVLADQRRGNRAVAESRHQSRGGGLRGGIRPVVPDAVAEGEMPLQPLLVGASGIVVLPSARGPRASAAPSPMEGSRATDRAPDSRRYGRGRSTPRAGRRSATARPSGSRTRPRPARASAPGAGSRSNAPRRRTAASPSSAATSRCAASGS